MAGVVARADAVKRHGRHYTPTALAAFLAERTLAHLEHPGPVVRVLDPACGDGELLIAVRQIIERTHPHTRAELTGFDLDEEAVAAAAQRGLAVGHGDFLETARRLTPGSFDLVITNPPYVRTQQLGSAATKLLAKEFGLKGRIDLTHPFAVLSALLLREGGVLGLLCSNRYLTTKAGENLRGLLRTSLSPREIHDLGDTRLFGASVLPAVTVAVRDEAREECTFTSAYATDDGTTLTEGLFEGLSRGLEGVVGHAGRRVALRSGRLDPVADPWRLSHPLADDWLRRLKLGTWKTFGEVAKIRVGVKTTADKVFISDDWPARHPLPESELLRPLITHHDLTAWQTAAPRARVLYPYELGAAKRTVVDLDEYPEAKRYLESHGQTLRARRYVTDGGRQWFEPWVAQQPVMWAVPKIVFPDISETARFAYDRSGAVVNGDCYWISQHDIGDEALAHLMLAVANSRLCLRFYDEVCGNRLYWGRRRWITQYVSLFPLPDPNTSASRRVIDAVVGVMNDGRSTEGLDDLVEQAFGL